MALATPFASASLYVGDLVNDVTEALLFEVFNAVGPVASVRVCRDAATRRSLGYAYVNFHRVEDAERALDTMNFKPIRNRPCRIMWSHRDPSLRKSGLGNIFVKNLHPSIDNKQLYDTFSMFGNILSVKVSINNSSRKSLGYGFVHYESAESAQDAVARVSGKVIAGQKVIVSPFRSKKERGVEEAAGIFTNIYVKNLPEDATEDGMKELFSKHGEITSSMLVTDEEGKTKGFGFINFATPEEATAAVEALNGHEWSDKKLFVGRAQKRDEREKELRDRFEQLKAERQKKYEGVNLYVKNLADDITEDKLREEFKQFGSVTSCKIMVDAAAKSRGFGFVCFASPEEATKAVTEMSNRMLEGKPLYVSLAQRKEARRAQLELQHTQRANSKMGGVPPQPQMYPPQGAPMFYAPGIPPRNFMYPQQMMQQQQQQQRRWQPGNPGNPPQMVMGGMQARPVGNYQLMPVPGQSNPRNGSSGGRGGRRNQNNMQGGKQQMQGQRRQMQQQQQQQGQQQQQFRGQQQQQGVPQQTQQEQAAEASPAVPAPVEGESTGAQPLTIKALAAAPKNQQKQMIGERLFPLVKNLQPEKAGKITGMLLEMDNGELIHLLESDQALNEKIGEACNVLEAAGQN